MEHPQSPEKRNLIVDNQDLPTFGYISVTMAKVGFRPASFKRGATRETDNPIPRRHIAR